MGGNPPSWQHSHGAGQHHNAKTQVNSLPNQIGKNGGGQMGQHLGSLYQTKNRQAKQIDERQQQQQRQQRNRNATS